MSDKEGKGTSQRKDTRRYIPLKYEDAERRSVLTRLATIRKLNATREWINNDLYRLMFKRDIYILAYERLKSNPGSMTPGTDKATFDGFGEATIQALIGEMRAETYHCRPVKTVFIPKANGKLRKLGLPSARDKLVQEVVRIILEAIYDSPESPYFLDSSHGFRRSRSCHSALREIQHKWSGVTWLIEGDIKACFDEIDHHILVELIRRKIKDERFIALIWKFLKAGYQDLDGKHKDSFAGTPQGGIISPILANIYLHELDDFVEQMRGELEQGKQRRRNPVYRSLAQQRQNLARTGRANTREYQELSTALRELPSLDPYDPGFVRLKYVRYADDWVIGLIGSLRLAEYVRERVRSFLQTKLGLTLSEEKTKITNARSEEAAFLGSRIRLGRSNRAKQKLTLSTNASGKMFKRRSTGMEIVLKAPIDVIVNRLHQKGFCDASGVPVAKQAWGLLDEDQIVNLYSSINRGIQYYYRPSDNWTYLRRIQYILTFSLAKTLATKRKTGVAKVLNGGSVQVQVRREGQSKTVTFYRNADWTVNRGAFIEHPEVDIVRMQIRLRTRSKLGWACCICNEDHHVEMHHVRHVRKMTNKHAKGFTRVMAALNRKQIPVCRECHRRIHNGVYDGLKLSDLAYDPSQP
jgi:group II intron reverse transcriptase/maturase